MKINESSIQYVYTCSLYNAGHQKTSIRINYAIDYNSEYNRMLTQRDYYVTNHRKSKNIEPSIDETVFI